MSKASDIQIAGDHYKSRAIQPWDYIAANNIGFFEGNAIKYLTRWRDKGGVEDLRKARHYIDKLIEMEVGKVAPDDGGAATWQQAQNDFDKRLEEADRIRDTAAQRPVEVKHDDPVREKWLGDLRKWGDQQRPVAGYSQGLDSAWRAAQERWWRENQILGGSR